MKKKLIYGIVGSGRVALHMARFFELEEIEYISWSRKQDSTDVSNKLSKCDIILVLISDKNIEGFIKENKGLKTKTLIHFSGALYSRKISGVHPLMTFGEQMYDLKTYRSIPFIYEEGFQFSKIFPKLRNKSYPIKPEKKGLYHALCVISGNFSVMLWQKVKQDFEEKLNLPWQSLLPYLEQTFKNIESDIDKSMTGPIVRDDTDTIKNNIRSLEEKEWKDLYIAFEKAYRRKT